MFFWQIQIQIYILFDKKGQIHIQIPTVWRNKLEQEYEYIWGDKKRANTNANVNIWTSIREYEYKYSSHTGGKQNACIHVIKFNNINIKDFYAKYVSWKYVEN